MEEDPEDGILHTYFDQSRAYEWGLGGCVASPTCPVVFVYVFVTAIFQPSNGVTFCWFVHLPLPLRVLPTLLVQGYADLLVPWVGALGLNVLLL
jgi:hypothetical protein